MTDACHAARARLRRWAHGRAPRRRRDCTPCSAVCAQRACTQPKAHSTRAGGRSALGVRRPTQASSLSGATSRPPLAFATLTLRLPHQRWCRLRRMGAVITPGAARALLVAAALHCALAFPVYVASNGTAVVTSAFGTDVVLAPDAGGAIRANAALNAAAGVLLNGTLLNEPLVVSLVASLASIGTQLATLSALLNPQFPVGYTFSFSTCGATGNLGPSLTSCLAAYQAYPWSYTTTSAGMSVGNRPMFSMGSLQTGNQAPNWQLFVVPTTGLYNIVAAGAAGAAGYYSDGCRGAILSTNVTLTAGTVLAIMVGQLGTGKTTLNPFGAAGGGTFVVFQNGTALLAAGGGGGGNQVNNNNAGNVVTRPHLGCDGSLNSTSGYYSSGATTNYGLQLGPQPGGVAGNGGTGIGDGGGGGGGFNSSGGGDHGGYGALQGGAGGSGWSGGFGGGGASGNWQEVYGADWASSGGGGGWSGGGGGTWYIGAGLVATNYGGGGGSYCFGGSFAACATSYNVGASGAVNVTLLSSSSS